MTTGQYTLDMDPAALAVRVKALEECCDILCAALADVVLEVRVMADACDKALCEDHPSQAGTISECHASLNRDYQKVHAASVKMGRSY